MKIKRRSFVTLALLAANQSFAKKSIFSNYTSTQTKNQKLKSLFGLKSHFFTSSLKSVFESYFESFQQLGYNNSFKGCLMDETKSYAICPINLTVDKKVNDEVLMFFNKEDDWKYIGVFNHYESELFLALIEKLKSESSDFEETTLLPKKRKIDGLNNPFLGTENSFFFKLNLEEKGIVGKVIYAVSRKEDKALVLEFA